jgi:hypothetical protein
MENKTNYTFKHNTKYTDYNLTDTPCQKTYDIYKHGTNLVSQTNTLDQIEDNQFWEKGYNYGNFVDGNGKPFGLKGICNAVIIDSCKDHIDDNDGICGVNNYINTKTYFLSYKSNKKVQPPTTFNNTL